MATALGLVVAIGAEGPAFASAGAPKKPGKVRVDRVSPHSIKLRWKDRARNETAYRVHRREQGERKWRRKRLPRNRKKLKTRGLDPGVVHEYRVRACNGRECSAWSPVRAQATLLAPSPAPLCTPARTRS